MSKRLRDAFATREAILGHWLSIGHTAVAELLAMADAEFVLIDLEHTATGWETLQSLVHAIESADGAAEPLVRLPGNNPEAVKRALDTGVSAIMAPMVDTEAEARALASAATYPPEGNRGVAGARAAGYGVHFQEYVESADESVTVIAQIERSTAVENVSEIAAVDGIDALFVGPADLSASLDTFGDLDSEAFTDAVETILEGAQSADTAVGLFVPEPADITHWLDCGFDFVVAGKDTIHLWDGANRVSDAFQAATAQDNDPVR